MASLKAKRKLSSVIYYKIISEAPKFLVDPSYTWMLGLMLWGFEIFLNLFIITRVKYTEIDWVAYMQEVEGFLNGTHDYMQLKGNTGPLVYPAGFVYMYSLLYYATSHGQNIRLAQYLFFIFYLVNLYLVIRIYHRTQKCPPYVLIFLCCTSYRVHSLFVLRLFNDSIAMLILFIALNLFIEKQWYIGSFFFSLAVSVKMNILLFAPGLLILFLAENGILKTSFNLGICAFTQLFLALPFLYTNPHGYIVRSFDLGRQFFHVWTVNWRFLDEKVFLDRRFHAVLLLLHLLVLLSFATKRWRKNMKHLFSLVDFNSHWKKGEMRLSPNQLVLVLFTSKFIGMCFSRSLHYQFYVWYYHSLPYLLWSTSYSSPFRLLLFGVIELCWNTYPSTDWSSFGLHVTHAFLLYGLWKENTIVLYKQSEKSKEKQR